MPIDESRLRACIEAAPDRIPAPKNPNRFRGRSSFTEPPVQRIDRNERARILAKAEAIETRTKQRGRHGGALGRPALSVLRTLLLKFVGPRGCFPSIATLMRVTGYCRQTIVTALQRLEAAGIVQRIRRVERRRIRRVSPVTGQAESYVGTVQTSNAYLIEAPGNSVSAPRPTDRAGFPLKGVPLLERLAAGFLGQAKPSLANRHYRQELEIRSTSVDQFEGAERKKATSSY